MERDGLCPAVRQSLKRLPPPYQNHFGVVPGPPPPCPSVIPVAARHQAALAALVQLETLATEFRDPWLISRVLVRREAVTSSALEGINSTLDALLAIEETMPDPSRGLQDAAVWQVRDYALCLDRLIPVAQQQGTGIFTEALISDLHQSVMRGDDQYSDKPGGFRDRVVWIGGQGDIAYSTYNPPPPEDIVACLADTLAYLTDQPETMMPASLVTRLAVAHTHFEAVHPFRDGNGRVGRLLLPLMMAAEGHAPLYLSAYIEANRSAYYQALQAAQQRHEWHAVIGFMADAITASVAELLATRRALVECRANWLTRRRFRRGSAALRALELLPHYPVITIPRLANLLAISRPQANAAVTQLCAAQILRERTGQHRNRLFAAPEVLSILNRPFGADPIEPDIAI